MISKPKEVSVEELGITFSTGMMARQAGGAVTVQKGDTVLFTSATAAKTVRPDQGYFPLMVDYREKFSAAGRFPGGYFKREGRPSEKEVLTSRLCDRPLRPLFPKGFMNEVQIIGMLLSTDLVNESDILMVNAASAALMVSDIPWNGPVACVRVGEINGEFVVNPTSEQLFESSLDLVYVGTETDMLMIEGSADQQTEARFIEALEFAHQQIQPLIIAQKKLKELVGKKTRAFDLVLPDAKVFAICEKIANEKLLAAVFQDERSARDEAIALLKDEAKEIALKELGEGEFDANDINLAFDDLQEKIYSANILDNDKRVDGRKKDELRTIDSITGLIPRVHGSALFQRGETQALVITTLGTSRDAQDLDALTGGAESKSFILHYNFPPYSVGETGRFIGPGRREIGHGALAERSLLPVIPSEEDFPYTIRIVSEIMESNGSSSMASICGGSLSLMDAGVPIIKPVAGISIGLVSRCDESGKITKYSMLTDIIGAEDHYGDMDFKIAGTTDGITGFQLDLKIGGLPLDIAKEAIAQSRAMRLNILDTMSKSLSEPNKGLKDSAPRIHSMNIDSEKIGLLIGPGGKNIKRITEVSGADIDIKDDKTGSLLIYAKTKEGLARAISEVDQITAEIEAGKTYRGVVRSVKDFGAFIECLPGKEALVHVSELADFRVDRVEDVCKVGDEMIVKCIAIDERGRAKLSRKAALIESEATAETV